MFWQLSFIADALEQRAPEPMVLTIHNPCASLFRAHYAVCTIQKPTDVFKSAPFALSGILPTQMESYGVIYAVIPEH